MENLKKMMGSAYKEGITVEEINAFLGSHKFVNIADGGYVDKDKYSRVVSEKEAVQKQLDELKESTKDYETLKSENEKYKGEKEDANLKTKLAGLGISESAFKYVKGDIADKSLTLGDDEKANKEAVKAYLKEHPQFASQPGAGRIRVVTTKVDGQDKPNSDEVKQTNDNFRAALGLKTSAE